VYATIAQLLIFLEPSTHATENRYMKSEPTYHLAESTLVEPLVNCWSAWPFLIAPAPASLHLLRYQLPLLQSYLDNPLLHAASQDLSLAGGAFVNVSADRASEVAILLERTKDNLSHNLEFAKSILEFQNWLVANVNGCSLVPYYQKIPRPLRGYVELVYDYFNRPSLRFFENLLYRSHYYNSALQSLRLSRLEQDSSRPFILNTPRLVGEGQIDWQVPFDAPQVDQLFMLDTRPQPFDAICHILDLNDRSREHLASMLTEKPRILPEKWKKNSVRVRYFGHACLLVESKGISIITDPLIAARPVKSGLERFSYSDLPEEIDYALITHNHQDHNSIETILRLRHRVKCLVVPKSLGILYGDISLKLLAHRIGFRNVIELDALESLQLLDGEITAVPFLGEHSDLAHGKTGYVIRLGKRQLLIGADSDCLDKQIYENVRRCIGRVDTVFIGTESVGAPLSWINGSLFPQKPSREDEESRRQHGCDARRAIDILQALGASRLYNYAMGMEPWLEHILGLGLDENAPQWRESEKLLAQARACGFWAAERLYGKTEIVLEEIDSTEELFMPMTVTPQNSGDHWIGAEAEFVFELKEENMYGRNS
jgi:L-ascorbate metabolism protein UlaG (beta-lactamase superfamily)